MPFAKVNGQELFYEDSGGEKPAIVFLHGFLFDQTMFDEQVKVLSADYRCIRFDARAFGQTKWDIKPFTLYDTAADCIGLLDHLGVKKASLVGMSQGGYASFRIALKYPERIESVVFLSTYNGVDTEDVKEIYRSMKETWIEVGPQPLMDTYSMIFLGPKEKTEALWSHWRPQWMKRNPQHVALAMDNLIDRDDIPADRLKDITMPTLVIHGVADQGIPINLGENVAKELPNCKGMIRVEEATHAANLTHPAPVTEALHKFFREHVYPVTQALPAAPVTST